MQEVWERLDSAYDLPMQFINELKLEVLAIPKIKDGESEKLLEYYETLRDNVGEAAKNNLQKTFLTSLNIDAMTQVLPPKEEELWRRAKRHALQEEMDLAFDVFMQERFEWFTGQVHELRDSVATSTPSPIDAARSGSVGGKHGKGRGTRKNAHTVPVQGGNKVKKSARASCYPARIRGSKRASDPAQKHGLTSKPAQERSQDTLSRKRSPEQDVSARSDGGY
jgi:hypothetical protein